MKIMEKKYYECYSRPLHLFLEQEGEEYLRKFIHNRTKVTCYVYEMNEHLEELLSKWTHGRKEDR